MNRDRLRKTKLLGRACIIYGKSDARGAWCRRNKRRRRLRTLWGCVPALAHLPIRIKIIAFSLPSHSGECAKVNLNYKALHPAGQYNEYAALKLSADNKNITLVWNKILMMPCAHTAAPSSELMYIHTAYIYTRRETRAKGEEKLCGIENNTREKRRDWMDWWDDE